MQHMKTTDLFEGRSPQGREARDSKAWYISKVRVAERITWSATSSRSEFGRVASYWTIEKAFACLLFLLLGVQPVAAGFVLGPGQVSTGASDGAFDLIAVDLTKSIILGSGTYDASIFNYGFADFGFLTNGTVAPLLLTGSGTTYRPVAIGNSISYTGPTAFMSRSFGGSSTFTLSASTEVFAGLYWKATDNSGQELRMPLGYTSGGNAFVVYGGGLGPGAKPPELGTVINGSAEGFFDRRYNFSVEVNAVPEPSGLTVGLLGLSGLIQRYRFRRIAKY